VLQDAGHVFISGLPTGDAVLLLRTQMHTIDYVGWTPDGSEIITANEYDGKYYLSAAKRTAKPDNNDDPGNYRTILVRSDRYFAFGDIRPVPGGDPGGSNPDGSKPPASAKPTMRFARSSVRLVRAACSRRAASTGVRDGARRWCHRLVVTTHVLRIAGGAPVAGRRVTVQRIVNRRAVLLGRGATRSRDGRVTVSRAIVVPAAHRGSLRAANRWLAGQTSKVRLTAPGARTITVARPRR
jgi:hypothetical protein